MWREVTIQIKASLPDGWDEEMYRSEMDRAIEVVEREIENRYHGIATTDRNQVRVLITVKGAGG